MEIKMNSRQYEKIMKEALNASLAEHSIEREDYVTVCLSADRVEYQITMKDGSLRSVPSGFEHFED